MTGRRKRTKVELKKLRQLREETGCNLAECRLALIEANYNVQVAKRILVRNNPKRFGVMDQLS